MSAREIAQLDPFDDRKRKIIAEGIQRVWQREALLSKEVVEILVDEWHVTLADHSRAHIQLVIHGHMLAASVAGPTRALAAQRRRGIQSREEKARFKRFQHALVEISQFFLEEALTPLHNRLTGAIPLTDLRFYAEKANAVLMPVLSAIEARRHVERPKRKNKRSPHPTADALFRELHKVYREAVGPSESNAPFVKGLIALNRMLPEYARYHSDEALRKRVQRVIGAPDKTPGEKRTSAR